MKLQRVSQAEHRELANAMRPYLAELAKIEGDQAEATSLDYSYLPLYWTESGREAYWLEEQGNRAGFALINTAMFVRSGAWSVSEFYVAPPWRRKGLGRQAVCALLALHPGWWEIGILPGHIAALSFWTIVLEGCSGVRAEAVSARHRRRLARLSAGSGCAAQPGVADGRPPRSLRSLGWSPLNAKALGGFDAQDRYTATRRSGCLERRVANGRRRSL